MLFYASLSTLIVWWLEQATPSTASPDLQMKCDRYNHDSDHSCIQNSRAVAELQNTSHNPCMTHMWVSYVFANHQHYYVSIHYYIPGDTITYSRRLPLTYVYAYTFVYAYTPQ